MSHINGDNARDFAALSNITRCSWADAKRDLRDRPRHEAATIIAAYIMDPPEWVLHVRLYQALLACPGISEVKCDRIIRRSCISGHKRLERLTSRQAALVAKELDREINTPWRQALNGNGHVQ